jgi:ethanolamine permease
MSSPGELKRVLKPTHLWAIAVGLVISGDYVGWNTGLASSGALGLIIATLGVTVLYVCFIFSFTELTTAIPSSGGPFAYASRALGPFGGYIAGFATLVDFVFAPPAIARGIGDYVNSQFPSVSKEVVAVGACLLFGLLNAVGVGLAATFELLITGAAVIELVVYCGLTGPHVQMSRLLAAPLLPGGWYGVFTAIPLAIWFYLGIEGVAMSAEEVIEPRKNIPRGYIAGIVTLVVLALATLICTAGVVPLAQLAAEQNDKPLLTGLQAVISPDSRFSHFMAYLGLCGLVASLHGLIMGASRQVYALARSQYLPRWLAYVHPRFRTPLFAIALPVLVGAAASHFDTTVVIDLAVLGAVVLYIISMVSLFVLRRREPQLERPFRAPFYPTFPAIALGLSCVALVAVCASTWASTKIWETRVPLIFAALFMLGLPYYWFVTKRAISRAAEPDLAPAVEP